MAEGWLTRHSLIKVLPDATPQTRLNPQRLAIGMLREKKTIRARARRMAPSGQRSRVRRPAVRVRMLLERRPAAEWVLPMAVAGQPWRRGTQLRGMWNSDASAV